MRKIALLFLTRKELNHPRFWEKMLGPYLDRFNIYIHSKEPMEDPFFKQFRVQEIVPTTHLQHVRPWQIMLREAIQDPDNFKFISLSEACIPLFPLELIYLHLIQDQQSYMQYGRPWWEENPNRTLFEIPVEHRWGNSEWWVLNRKHAQLIVDDHEIINIAAQRINDNESYPSTLYSLRGCLDDIVNRHVNHAYRLPSDHSHTLSFKADDQECIKFIELSKEWKSLFVRKFEPEFPETALFQIQQPISSDNRINLEEMSMSNMAVFLTLLIENLHLKVGYEVGAYTGCHMLELLNKTQLIKIFGVDPYLDQDDLYELVKERLAPYRSRVDLLRQSSEVFSKVLPDHSVDFVFIHDAHCQESLSELLKMWYPKIKSRGVLSGYHTLLDGKIVPDEVVEFFEPKGIKVENINQVERGFWWILNP